MHTSSGPTLSAKLVEPLQPLSPERVNSIRPASASTKTSKGADITSKTMDWPSPQSSPTRKTNLFADYNPHAGSEAKDTGFALSQSPSLSELHAFRSHCRTNSDVQGLVKRFEHLDVRDRDAEFVERKKRHEAELRRAQVAREEAESDVKKLREEVRRLKKEGDDGRERERKVAKRLEVVMEEFTSSKESHATQIASYEKETRKARKEAFKSSSAVVKLQEGLKATRNTLHVTQADLEMEKLKAGQRDQDAFKAQYKLVALQEELEKMQSHVTIVEQEKEALKACLKEEEVARIAAEGMIALPAANSEDDTLMGSPIRSSPRKAQGSPLSDDKENIGVITRKALDGRRLEEEIARERFLRQHAESLLEFLRLECQFQCCFCRTREFPVHDERLVVPQEINQTMQGIKKGMEDALRTESISNSHDEDMDETIRPTEPTTREEVKPTETAPDGRSDVEVMSNVPELNPSEEVNNSVILAEPFQQEEVDHSVTMMETTPEQHSPQEQMVAEEPLTTNHQISADIAPILELVMEDETIAHENLIAEVPQPARSQTPPELNRAIPPRQRPSIRTITTTTTIPMQFSPVKPLSQPAEDSEHALQTDEPQPAVVAAPTIDRAAALAAIAYRRGRAKSIANGHATPRKQMIEGVSITQRRDISAPMLGQKTEAPVVAKGSASVGRAPGTRMV